MLSDDAILRRQLEEQSFPLDAATLQAVTAWHAAWRREWEHVRRLALGDEDLPAPLWCWPP
ncbi:MAG TPA: hypothetical protein VGR25_11210 [bacterium]|jgi:hypothetical protein|nr:hypothetical protein [bacterium]